MPNSYSNRHWQSALECMELFLLLPYFDPVNSSLVLLLLGSFFNILYLNEGTEPNIIYNLLKRQLLSPCFCFFMLKLPTMWPSFPRAYEMTHTDENETIMPRPQMYEK